MIDALHGVLEPMIPGWTRDQTQRAFSGYGNFSPLSKDEMSVGLRDLKGQTQQLLKIEALEARKPLEKTGVERRQPSFKERLLQKIVNELKRGAKGYRKCTSLDDWLANAFFEYHASVYNGRPIYWHIASALGTSPFAFGALVHYHRFDKNRMAKLRASYVRDTIEELRRDAGLADKAGRTDDRVELQAKLEEVQALDKKLQLIQEGHHEGAEGGDRDFRILTPWKEPAKRPNGWAPDLDDGVKVNIAPLDRACVLRASGVAG